MSKSASAVFGPRGADMPPHRLLMLAELRAFGEFATGALLRRTVRRCAPAGDGHPVLVLPGLFASDRSTALLRRFLREQGYVPVPWGFGRNRGVRPGMDEHLRERLHSLHTRHGTKVSLVGQSLGGLFARELAKFEPQYVRQVITLGSPFTGDLTATRARRLYERLSGERLDELDPELPGRLRIKPPVPTSSIYSKLDGVVRWHCSIEPGRPEGQSIHLRGSSHLGMAANPAALYLIAHLLAEPEGAWRPFAPQGWQRLLYGIDGPAGHGLHQPAAVAPRQAPAWPCQA
jgi:hypothetical protein